MSNSTPRAALPPLPNPMAQVVTISTDDGKKARVIRALDLKWIVGADGRPLYTAEQVEQIRRETVMACAEIAEREADNWHVEPEKAIAAAILALLPVKD